MMVRPARLRIAHTCQQCGAGYIEYPSAGRRFCSRQCARGWQTVHGRPTGPKPRVAHPRTFDCEHCGKTTPFTLKYRKGKVNGHTAAQRFCSTACANYARGPSKGTIHHTGYRYISVPGRGTVAEHRLVMERRIGRKLKKHETVHHVNGQRADNGDANLELWSTMQPKGQRVEDKIAFAMALLEEYDYLVLPPQKRSVA